MLGCVTNNSAPVGPRGVHAPVAAASTPGTPSTRSFQSFLQASGKDDVANEGEAHAPPEDTADKNELDDHDEDIGATDEDPAEVDRESDGWNDDSSGEDAPAIAVGEAQKDVLFIDRPIESGPLHGTMPAADAALARGAGEETNAFEFRDVPGLKATNTTGETLSRRTGNLEGWAARGPATPSGAEAIADSAHDASLKAQEPGGESHLKTSQGIVLPLTLREAFPGAVPRPDVPVSWLADKSTQAPVDVTGASGDAGLAEAADSSSAGGSRPTVRAVAEIAMASLLAPDGFLQSDERTHAAPEVRIAPSFAPEPRASMAPPSSPETARHIAAQVIEAMGKNADRALDVILNPAELGRVRITLSHGDAGMIVNLAAERGETLDLMRRHSDLLGQEFEDLGYGATDFSFSHDNASDDRQAPSVEVALVAAHLPPDQPQAGTGAQAGLAVAVDRLDIRL